MSSPLDKKIKDIISHDINNPLMIIQIAVERLKRNHPELVDDNSIAYIEESTERIKKALSQLLDQK